jgi:serine/threonine protein kinase
MLTPSGRDGDVQPGAFSSLVGSVVGGKYRIKRLLGHGGMGSVYKAENVAIGRTVALKILHTHLADDGTTLARFQREARIAASAGHEHVVEVLDMGVEPTGAPFIVMEYVRGQSLSKLLTSGGPPIPVERAARIAGGILSGLAAVHSRGIVHRDLKPENVMLTTKNGVADYVKIFDFGISTFVEALLDPSAPFDLTPSGRTMGTPYYASPEQIQGERGRDARVDIYAVGVLLYEMLAGHKPFAQKSFPELCRAILDGRPAPLRAFRDDVPAELERIVLRALSKSPLERFQKAGHMEQALVPFGADPPREEPEPTDTFTWDMRELRAREALMRDADGHIESKPPPSEEEDGVRGEVLRAMLDHLRDRLGGPRYERLLDDSEPAVAKALRRKIDPAAWYPGSLLAVLEHADLEYAGGEMRMIADTGRQLARRAIGRGSREAMLRTVTPELVFAMSAELWSRFFAVGEAKVSTAARGLGRLEIGKVSRPSLSRTVAMMGFLDEALITAGARGVDVRLASSTALGDPSDVLEATWSS